MDNNTCRPVIGVSFNHEEGIYKVARQYCDAIILCGGIPVLLPLADEVVIDSYLEHIDGLLMTGGGDIAPHYFGAERIPEAPVSDEERDAYDVALIRKAQQRNIPILGICRGMQIINVVFGGDIYQDIATEFGASLVHSQNEPKHVATHHVTIEGGRLANIIQQTTLDTNTFHHQAIKSVAPEFVATAHTSDGIIEAIEHLCYPILGVQWHPEHLTMAGDEQHKALFKWIVEAAEQCRHAKELHNNMISIDSHTDTPMVWNDNTNLGQRCDEAQVDFVKMKEGYLDAACCVAYIPQQELNDATRAEAFVMARHILQRITNQCDSNSDIAFQCLSPAYVISAKEHNKRGLIAAVENGFAIGKDLDNINRLYNLGARYLTLCHNGDNDICDSASHSQHTHNGLSDYGREVVQRCNELGMMIDLSHANEKSFWDVLECSTAPVICTHSSARALCDHPRNLTDAQIVALAKKNGLVQICLYGGFLCKEHEATIDDALNHLDHIVKLVGVNHVGFGSDFDGGTSILGCRSANEEMALTIKMIQRGYSDEDIRRVRGGNFLSFWEKVITAKNSYTNEYF